MRACEVSRFNSPHSSLSKRHASLRYKLTNSQTFFLELRVLLDATIGTCFIFPGIINVAIWGAARDAI
jgi:hypothetical protein